MFYGALIALITAISFIYQFGKASAFANERAREYLRLMRRIPSITDDEQLLKEFDELESSDSKVCSLLDDAVYQKTVKSLGLTDEFPVTLSPIKKVASFIAGCLQDKNDYLKNHAENG